MLDACQLGGWFFSIKVVPYVLLNATLWGKFELCWLQLQEKKLVLIGSWKRSENEKAYSAVKEDVSNTT